MDSFDMIYIVFLYFERSGIMVRVVFVYIGFIIFFYIIDKFISIKIIGIFGNFDIIVFGK